MFEVHVTCSEGLFWFLAVASGCFASGVWKDLFWLDILIAFRLAFGRALNLVTRHSQFNWHGHRVSVFLARPSGWFAFVFWPVVFKVDGTR